ncbi:Uncharacterized membrane protein YkvA, DUF1232 family [Nonlabens sp. Hel1_33_55]|uniref:YkvA family protein n=1 Tax=Nonlabens sp. Hel1_33_55 TaxID=1336802 RepID=UPI000875BE68|nr:YkvA family protein [Nonlabens sp. Hel1_33_55]SCX87391.1 Uncharacterized membrane protein YkvA, DUF1232 family [Nonlabens sp. Hel1_33_55]
MSLKDTFTPDEEYVRDQTENTTTDDVDKVIKREGKISFIMSTVKVLKKYYKLFDVMMMMIKDYRKGIYTAVPWFTIAAIGGALLYVLSPFDLIPDFIPGLGYLDDMTVMTIVVGWIDSDLHKYLDWKLSHNLTTPDEIETLEQAK